MLYDVTINGKNHRLELNRAGERWLCRLDARELEIDALLVRPHVLSLRIGNLAYEIKSERSENGLQLWIGSACFSAEVSDPRSLRSRSRAKEDQGPRKITASMPGKVVRLLVQAGDSIEAGMGIIVVEAMKMQNEIKSPKKGKVEKILVSPGTAVNAGDVMAIID
ncbi:MAG TPA: biotin/lipoyl-containing protein [Candidatus Sulfotelmatobacter sp.]